MTDSGNAFATPLSAQFDQMKLQLRRSQKLASIGTTAAMVAHEFNNLFTPVVAYAQHALETEDVELMKLALNKARRISFFMTG